MWQIKTFKTKEKLDKFLARNPKIEWQEIFINNGYGVEYRKLRIINI